MQQPDHRVEGHGPGFSQLLQTRREERPALLQHFVLRDPALAPQPLDKGNFVRAVLRPWRGAAFACVQLEFVAPCLPSVAAVPFEWLLEGQCQLGQKWMQRASVGSRRGLSKPPNRSLPRPTQCKLRDCRSFRTPVHPHDCVRQRTPRLTNSWSANQAVAYAHVCSRRFWRLRAWPAWPKTQWERTSTADGET